MFLFLFYFPPRFSSSLPVHLVRVFRVTCRAYRVNVPAFSLVQHALSFLSTSTSNPVVAVPPLDTPSLNTLSSTFVAGSSCLSPTLECRTSAPVPSHSLTSHTTPSTTHPGWLAGRVCAHAVVLHHAVANTLCPRFSKASKSNQPTPQQP